MKLIKKKEVLVDEIDILPGTYYFECEDIISRKFILKEDGDGYSNYSMESLHSLSNKTGIITINEILKTYLMYLNNLSWE